MAQAEVLELVIVSAFNFKLQIASGRRVYFEFLCVSFLEEIVITPLFQINVPAFPWH